MKYWLRTVLSLLLVAVPLPAQTISDFFDPGALQEVRLQMEPVDWTALHEKYLENTWYRCQMEWRGMTVSGVSVRSRGSGSRNPIKPALSLDFSRVDKAQRFLGLKTVVLRNFAQDPSMIHERLAEMLFARLGLPYSREVHTRLYVNGEYVGVYMLVEPVDERFLNTRLGEENGYLFEFNWLGNGYHFEYLGDDPGAYVPEMFEPKTHSSDPDAEWLVNMIRGINFAPDAEVMATLSKYIDPAAFMAHVAAEQFAGEWDGVLGETGMTNFYLYRRDAGRPALFLVWDKDGSMTQYTRSIWRNMEHNVLTRRLLTVPALRQRYLETLHHAAEIAGGAGGWLEQEAVKACEQIRQAAHEDPYRVCVKEGGIVPCTVDDFEAAISQVREFAARRAEIVAAELKEAGFTPPAGPHLAPESAYNAASYVPVLTPGALARVSLTRPNGGWKYATATPLPEELDGVSVLLGGARAPLVSVTPWEAVFQVPPQVLCGPIVVEVSDHGTRGIGLFAEVRPSNAGVFAMTHLDGSVVSSAQPARAGEIVVLWTTGGWPMASDQPAGVAAPASGDPVSTRNLTVLAAGSAGEILWAGQAPGFVGLEQIVIRLPAELPAATGSSLVLYQGGEPGATYWFASSR